MSSRIILSPGVIANDSDIAHGVRVLRRRCPVMRRIHDATGDPPLRLGAKGFRGLVEIVVSQQVSAAAADTIFARTEKVLRPLTPERVLKATEVELRSCGLSGPKIKALHHVAQAITEDQLNFRRLHRADDLIVHRDLTAISGIGPWSADIYLMFCMGRTDSWAAGDLALQLALQRAMDLASKPDAAACLDLAEQWRPYRAVAARLLWAFYSLPKAPQSASTKPRIAAKRQ